MVQKHTLLFWLISILKWIQNSILDTLLSRIFDYTTLHGSTAGKRTSLQYEKSAQRVKILCRGAYSLGTAHFLENFLYKHMEYSHPKEVLKSDNITLMVRSFAIFKSRTIALQLLFRSAYFCAPSDIAKLLLLHSIYYCAPLSLALHLKFFSFTCYCA